MYHIWQHECQIHRRTKGYILHLFEDDGDDEAFREAAIASNPVAG